VLAPLPEIKRCDIAFAMLQQKSLGYDFEKLDFMDMPELSTGRFIIPTFYSLFYHT
jgi:HrpA-like RNA helicase